MKTYLFWVFLLIGFGLSSCKKEEDEIIKQEELQEEVVDEDYPYEAIVLRENSDCHVFSIGIQKDLPTIEAIVGRSLDNVYIARNLPEDLQIEGLQILLDLREPTVYELGWCTDRGPSYEWLTVIRAKRKYHVR